MAEAEPPAARGSGAPRPRVRAGRKPPRVKRPRRYRGLGLLVLILFAMGCFSVLAIGLINASNTIFAVGPGHRQGHPHQLATALPSDSALLGKPVDGSVLALYLADSEIAIQPQGQQPVEALVTAHTVITVAGAQAPLASVIPGDAVVATFTQTPGGQLELSTLQDVQSFPTNTPTPTPDLYPFIPYGGSTPSPTPAAEGTPVPAVTP